MRFTCEKYLLSLAVSTAGRAAASKSPVSALEGLLLEAGETGVRITGFDLKKGIYTSFAADVAEPVEAMIAPVALGRLPALACLEFLKRKLQNLEKKRLSILV